MALLKRTTVGLGLLLGGFVLAAGCGSDDKVKAVAQSEGGEAGLANGGQDGNPGGTQQGGSQANVGAEPGLTSAAGAAGVAASSGSGGAAGAEPAASGGAGGAPALVGGAAGASQGQAGEAGAGGFAAVECTASGETLGLSFSTQNTFKVCRGSIGLLEFHLDSSDQQFTCCGTSDSGYAFEGRGVADNDGGGTLTYTVPYNAPLGIASLDVTCEVGTIATPVTINVVDGTVPVIDAVTAVIAPGGTITVTGSKLTEVTRMDVIPVDPLAERYYCNIDAQTQTDTQVQCALSGGAPGGEYTVSVYVDRCGALESPKFSVIEG